MWIGVISDTAGVLPTPVMSIFDGVDYILHCGNIGDPSLLDELSQIAPITGVLGNGDNSSEYPFERTLFRKWFDVGVYMNYRVGDPMNLARTTKKEIEELDPQVVLFGGNGESFNNRVENRLFLNPGTGGRRRVKNPRTVGLLEIEGHSVRAEIVPLEPEL
ncbi:MAG: hypothetical protein CMJ83_16570 [Planctomycetes bacterium]|nr:hypothetical protein [Planctomycetota bacterium]